MIFDLIFRYFPFFAVAINLFNLWLLRRRLTRPMLMIYSGGVMLFLVWGSFQLIGGYDSFFFVFWEPLSQPLVAMFWIIYFLTSWGTAAWILFGNGAKLLAEGGFVRGVQRPREIKIFFASFYIIFPIVLWLARANGFFAEFQ